MDIINQTECKDWYAGKLEISNSSICGAAIGNKYCQTDVGGSLTVNGTLEGVVSVGCDVQTDSYDDLPFVYSRVAYVRDWIRKITKV